ncbi:hypothetical protein TNCV_3873311 [Trichonephila clavipes]|nr:hypothetical protein TNCV_3873311 [Trichonephila clavipes]
MYSIDIIRRQQVHLNMISGIGSPRLTQLSVQFSMTFNVAVSARNTTILSANDQTRSKAYPHRQLRNSLQRRLPSWLQLPQTESDKHPANARIDTETLYSAVPAGITPKNSE